MNKVAIITDMSENMNLKGLYQDKQISNSKESNSRSQHHKIKSNQIDSSSGMAEIDSSQDNQNKNQINKVLKQGEEKQLRDKKKS